MCAALITSPERLYWPLCPLLIDLLAHINKGEPPLTLTVLSALSNLSQAEDNNLRPDSLLTHSKAAIINNHENTEVVVLKLRTPCKHSLSRTALKSACLKLLALLAWAYRRLGNSWHLPAAPQAHQHVAQPHPRSGNWWGALVITEVTEKEPSYQRETQHSASQNKDNSSSGEEASKNNCRQKSNAGHRRFIGLTAEDEWVRRKSCSHCSLLILGEMPGAPSSMNGWREIVSFTQNHNGNS